MRTPSLRSLAFLLPLLVSAPSVAQTATAAAAADGEAEKPADSSEPAADGEAKAEDAEQEQSAAAANPLLGLGGAGDGKIPFPLKAFVSMTSSIGQGTFVLDGWRNPNVATTLTAVPYIAWEKWWFMYSQSVSQEWTQPDDGSRQFQPYVSDGTVSVRYWGLSLSDTGVRFPVTVRASLPFSLTSRNTGQLTGLSGTFAAQWITPFQMLLSASVNGGYNVIVPSLAGRTQSQETRPYADKYNDGALSPAQGCLTRDPLETANFGCGFIPRIANLSGGLSAIWFPHAQVNVNASVSMGTALSYFNSPDDAYTSEYARPGLGFVYNTRSSLSVSYSPMSWLWLSAGVDTGQPLFQANGSDYRWFPFWDVISPANNMSVVTLDATFIL